MNTISCEEFLEAARKFVDISKRICDGWKLFINESEIYKSYLKKESFINCDKGLLLKTEYIIFYNISYGVPSFSFNIWNSSGVLLTLEEIRQLSFIRINKEDFYSVITQQEHPIFFRPYFIMHPCHTATLLEAFRNSTKNIIVTFLGLITPLLNVKLPVEYGL